MACSPKAKRLAAPNSPIEIRQAKAAAVTKLLRINGNSIKRQICQPLAPSVAADSNWALLILVMAGRTIRITNGTAMTD